MKDLPFDQVVPDMGLLDGYAGVMQML